MRHVVLGGCGFTGRHLVRRLQALKERVLVVDLPEADWSVVGDAEGVRVDLRDPTPFPKIPLGPDDVVHHTAARQFHNKVPRRSQDAWFREVNVEGTRRVLDYMELNGCRQMVYFSSDMVYGLPESVPVPSDHPLRPLGPYGRSKRDAEEVCKSYRARGFRITILRPRLIVGPGRLGILVRLFQLIDHSLPVILVGDGRNRYQMVSVFDCVQAVEGALSAGLPNSEYNLGSIDPPPIREVLKEVIRHTGSRSILIPTHGPTLKTVLGLLDRLGVGLLHPEQFLIADLNYLVDTSATRQDLGWQPQYGDGEMLLAGYREFKSRRRPAPDGL